CRSSRGAPAMPTRARRSPPEPSSSRSSCGASRARRSAWDVTEELMRSRLLLALVVAVLLRANALAGEPDAQPRSAHEHDQRAQKLFRENRFADAALEWKAAYELSKEASLLFNLALAEEARGDRPLAIAAYQQYLALEPQGRVAGEARRHVAKLS